MSWQDLTLTSVNIVFSVSLVPQIVHGFRTKTGGISFFTSIPTFLGLYLTSFTFITLGLVFSACMSGIAATLWLILCIQRWLYRENRAILGENDEKISE